MERGLKGIKEAHRLLAKHLAENEYTKSKLKGNLWLKLNGGGYVTSNSAAMPLSVEMPVNGLVQRGEEGSAARWLLLPNRRVRSRNVQH